MDEKTLLKRKRNNLGWILFAAAAVFWVTGVYRGKTIALAGYIFCSVIAFPGLIALLGREARGREQDKKGLICSGAGMILLGYAQKILLFWVETLLGRAPMFYPFSTSGAPWLFLVGGVYLILAGTVRKREWMQRRLLPVTIAIGLFAGLIKPISDDLCLSRLAVYLPFFVLGYQLDPQALLKRSRGIRTKLTSLAMLGGWGVACLLLRHRWKDLRPLFDGNKSYFSIDGLPGAGMGLVGRLVIYLLAMGLLYALFVLVPAWKLPVLSGQGKRWKAGCFWFAPMVRVLCLPMGKKLTFTGAAITGALCLAWLLIAPSKPMERLPQAILTGVERLRRGEVFRREETTLGGGFLRRHRWGVRMTGLFTLCFLVIAVGYVYPFYTNGKSLVWNVDGIQQQYPAMFAFQRYISSAVSGFLATGRLAFPQWDFTLGFGMSPLDAIRREPFMLLSLLGNEATMETIMDVTLLLRLYVCGLVFIWYCHTLGKREEIPVLAGAMAYVGSGFAAFGGVRQPYFITVFMTYEVLMLIGAERFIQKRKYGVFVFSVFLQLLSGYYSAFVNGLVLSVYLLVRLGCLYGKDIRKTVSQILKLIGLYTWGACMAMFSMLPGVLNLLRSPRSGGGYDIEPFYSYRYYRTLLGGLNLEFDEVGHWTHVGMASVVWLACVLLFLRKRKELTPLKVGLAAGGVLITLPIFGLISNGFAYISNRWCFSIALLGALILVEMLPDFLTLSRRDKLVLTGLTVAYCVLVVTQQSNVISTEMAMGLLILCMTLLVVLFQNQVIRSRQLRMASLALVTAATVLFHLAASFLPELGGYSDAFVGTGKAYSQMSGMMGKALPLMEEDDTFYRISQQGGTNNQGAGLGYYSTNTYFSVIPSGTSQFFIDLCLNSQKQTFCITGLDDRAALEALAAVKYYVARTGATVPYGFETGRATEDGKVTVFENRNALPLGYTYTSYVTEQEFDTMTPLERQQVMLESGVVTYYNDFLEHNREPYEEQKIPCTVKSAKNVKVDWESGKLDAEEGGSLQLQFQGEPECETYLVIPNLGYRSGNSSSTCIITGSSSVRSNTLLLRGPKQSYYFDRDAAVFHLGYSKDALNSCTLGFASSLEAKFDDIYVVCVPVTHLDDQVNALREVVLEDVSERGDHISGSITVEENRLLTFTIPYTPGWTAYVNGQEREVIPVNGMYFGLMLEPGSHEIELEFRQPGQSLGNWISVLAVGALIPVALVHDLRRRRNKHQELTQQSHSA